MRKSYKLQNYLCKDCGRQFIADHEHTYKGTTTDIVDLIKRALVRECVIRDISVIFLISVGSLICVGKGNPDWNCSTPHGAGRLMSRSATKASITLTQFQRSMDGIYSSTVNKSTVDESPMAYKPMREIVDNIGDTAEIVKIIKPVYNFKAAE